MGLFSKKNCSVCGGEIGLLGNRKLEDGNLCKNCAAKLSPWFTERRKSTVEDIKAQLEYREANKEAVKNFKTTRSIGDYTKVLFDEDAKKFMVSRGRKLEDENPDVLDYSMITDVKLDIEEDKDEAQTQDKDGKSVSYNPPRYKYGYDFKIKIQLNHPYFDDIEFQLNSSRVETTDTAVPAMRKPDPRTNVDYCEYEKMGNEIVSMLSAGRQQIRDAAAAAAAPKVRRVCPGCGATTAGDANNCCEYCGTPLN
ncbi:MAG: DUF4428 domain-containing protein [Firmicutes bacterium]|nr:DUF4428 domain-containing protein [Bacillota bacterium]